MHKRIWKTQDKKILLKELKGCYRFFIKESNQDPNSKGYGLVRDKTVLANEIASIASVGYGLGALIIGVEHDWVRYEKAKERASKTLDTFLNIVEGENGFFYHFVNMNTGKREWNCEISIIDTAIFLCGALAAGEFFGGEIKQKAKKLYENANWQWYTNKETNQFYMGYKPESGFWGKWDLYAEQLMLYILGTASPTYPISETMYRDMGKARADYKDIQDIIYSYTGSLFTYQFSHAWVDFRGRRDPEGINWFENSVKATKANRQYCIDQKQKHKTYGKNSWGLTACAGPNGYSGGYGAKPASTDLEKENDGTVSPCGAAGSIVFTPKESIEALRYFYHNVKELWGKYGFLDSYNIEEKKEWYAVEYIGIDKGISMVMIENYLSGSIWNCFMSNEFVQKGLEILDIKKQNEKKVTY